MLAHDHGQLWNGAEFARSFGVSAPTVRRHLDLLTSTFVVRQLEPWTENLGKRQVKSPRVHVADTGFAARRRARGKETFPLGKSIRAVAAGRLLQDL